MSAAALAPLQEHDGRGGGINCTELLVEPVTGEFSDRARKLDARGPPPTITKVIHAARSAGSSAPSARPHEGAPLALFPSRQIAIPKAHETTLVRGKVDTYCL